jgi:phosphatidylglycerol:prolipoprotein diacylglycerol transferase
MRKILFSIGKLNIPGYGFMIGIGFIVALIIGELRAKKKGLDKECVLDMAIIAIVTGFLGAKLLFVIVNFRDFLDAPLSFLGSSGFVVYGGIIAGVACCILYCHFKKIKFLQYFDIIMPEVAIAQGFGRIGCFLAGCCYGRVTTSSFGVVFPADSFAPSGVKLIPTQLISAIGDFVIAAILIIIADVVAAKFLNKVKTEEHQNLESDISKFENQNTEQNSTQDNESSNKNANKNNEIWKSSIYKSENTNQDIEIVKNGKSEGLQRGTIGAIYLILYGIGRFAVEFLRDDLRGAVGALSTSQFISLFIVAGGIALLVLHRTFDKKSFKRAA